MTHLALIFTIAVSALTSAAPLQPRRLPPNEAYINFGVNTVQADPIDYEKAVYVTYDFGRILPLVNATIETPNTTVTAFYKLNNVVTSVPLFNTDTSFNSPHVYIRGKTATGPLSFWFSAQVGSNAPVYDSSSGDNFNFFIHGGVIKFLKGYTSTVSGALKAATPLGIRMMMLRGVPVQTVTAFWIASDQSGQGAVYDARYVTRNGLVTSVYTVTIPAEQVVPGELQVYFSCKTAIGSSWDSAYGKNWRFTVSA
ncbi:hypothetical protein BC829DRAFT_490841 [Chytridium lagenaria]|nr:hypothetical protein BC829DRAFT_490841 [Chytridium lagenaria]